MRLFCVWFALFWWGVLDAALDNNYIFMGSCMIKSNYHCFSINSLLSHLGTFILMTWRICLIDERSWRGMYTYSAVLFVCYLRHDLKIQQCLFVIFIVQFRFFMKVRKELLESSFCICFVCIVSAFLSWNEFLLEYECKIFLFRGKQQVSRVAYSYNLLWTSLTPLLSFLTFSSRLQQFLC